MNRVLAFLIALSLGRAAMATCPGERDLTAFAPSAVAVPESELNSPQEEARRFWNLMVRVFPFAKIKSPGPLSVVSVGSGAFADGPVLPALFGHGRFGENDPRVQIFGIDADETMQDHVRSMPWFQLSNFHFVTADARCLCQLEKVPVADVVILRHPRVLQDLKPNYMWKDVLAQSFKKLRKHGIFVVTTYYNLPPRHHEFDLMLEWTKGFPMKVYFQGSNPDDHSTDVYAFVAEKLGD